MRLTTLARKVGRTPSQIIAFLENNQIEITNGANTKLDDAAIALVLEEYEIELVKPRETAVELPVEPEEIIAEIPVEVEEIPVEPIVDIAEPEIPPLEEIPKVRTGTIDDLESGDHSEIDHIKAKKVKLEGFKVVGKIELPQKPVKAPVTEEEASTPEEVKKADPVRSPRKQRSDFQKHDRRPKHDRQPLTYEERLKKEERIRDSELQKKLQEDKERKVRYYEQHIAPKAPAKAPKKKPQNANSAQAAKPSKVVYTNPLHRFWAWVNGKLDNY
ncbi:MAG: hypothetical protein U5K79_16740 [Cyclobacteriaceae bacterium]|nr:hypothetical protein [Cyclobacteriaceae bacterium]